MAGYPPAEAVADLVARLPALPAGWRVAPPERWHLTLAFLGEVPEGRVEDLSARVGRAAARTAPIGLRLAGGGSFGQRVLWVGLAGERPALVRLAERVSAAARRTGVEVETRRFRPHLTVARTRVTAGAPDQWLGSYAGPGWTLAEVVLVRSHLDARPRHERLAGWPLSAPRSNPTGSGADSTQT